MVEQCADLRTAVNESVGGKGRRASPRRGGLSRVPIGEQICFRSAVDASRG